MRIFGEDLSQKKGNNQRNNNKKPENGQAGQKETATQPNAQAAEANEEIVGNTASEVNDDGRDAQNDEDVDADAKAE